MSPSPAPSNTDVLKAQLGPLAWAEPVLDRFFKVRAFDAFLARIHAAGRPDLFTSAMEQAGSGLCPARSAWSIEASVMAMVGQGPPSTLTSG